MSRYIDAEILPVLFDEEFKKTRVLILNGETHLDNLAEGFFEADRVIKKLPTADVVEVKHGKWDKTPIDKDIFQTIRCSKCGKQALFAFNINAFGDQELFRFPSNYCPTCGAKMNESEKDNG